MNSKFNKENYDQNLYRYKNVKCKVGYGINDLRKLNSYCIDDKKSSEIDDAISIEYKNGRLQKKEIELRKPQLRDIIVELSSKKTIEFLSQIK